MKRTRKYTAEPLGRLEVVEDFLLPPIDWSCAKTV